MRLRIGSSYRRVTTCNDFLGVRASTDVPPEPYSDADAKRLRAYAYCVPLFLLRRATASSVSHFQAPETYGAVIYNDLDLRTLRSSKSPLKGTTSPVTLASEHLSGVRIGPLAVEIDDPGWAFALRVLASGDFTGDGIEDLLVLLDDTGKRGTYADVSAKVLQRLDLCGRVTAVDFPK